MSTDHQDKPSVSDEVSLKERCSVPGDVDINNNENLISGDV